MIGALTLLLGCQLAGEAVARAFALAVPGPVIGLVLMVIGLIIAGRVSPRAAKVEETALGKVSAVILANLSLLFVPAGTGIVQHLGTLIDQGIGLLVALIVSTILTLVVTALVFRAVAGPAPATDEDQP